MNAASETTDLPPEYVKGFGRQVRLATAHNFHSRTTPEQIAGPEFIAARRRKHILSLVIWVLVLAIIVIYRGWIREQIGAALTAPFTGVLQILTVMVAIILLFLGAFAFMRLGEAALRATLDADDPTQWPREDVDWGEQNVMLERDTLAVSLDMVRREYPWESLATLYEDEVYTLERRQGDSIVIPKDPADEDELADRLLRGIMIAPPQR